MTGANAICLCLAIVRVRVRVEKPDLRSRPTRNCSRRLSTPVMHVGLNLIFIAIVTI